MEAGEDNKSACAEIEKKILEKLEDNIEKINYSVNVEQGSSTNINESITIDESISNEWKNSTNNCEITMIKTQEDKSTHSKKSKDAATFKKKFGMSDSDLVNKKTNSGFAKILQWDPWHKIRRNKKKDKHKKFNKKVEFSQKIEGSSLNSFDMKSIEESVYDIVPLHPKDEYDAMFNPRKHKAEKIVRFQSDVTVVLFGNDQILGETVEPLKKELEQQERNKELRKEVCPEGFKGGNWKKANDYMSSWYIRRK